MHGKASFLTLDLGEFMYFSLVFPLKQQFTLAQRVRKFLISLRFLCNCRVHFEPVLLVHRAMIYISSEYFVVN